MSLQVIVHNGQAGMPVLQQSLFQVFAERDYQCHQPSRMDGWRDYRSSVAPASGESQQEEEEVDEVEVERQRANHGIGAHAAVR